MQQLLGDRPGVADGSFLRELFLQRLPGNVRMVLASTQDTVSLEKLAELADRIVEVATPSISAVTTASLTTELEQMRTEMSRLQQLVKASFPRRTRSHSRPFSGRSPSPTRPTTPQPPQDASLC